MEKRIAAFFDIDGTLYREGLITEVFKKMIRYEIIEQERWFNDVKPEYTKWDKRQGDYDNYLLKMIEIYMEAIKGLTKDQIEFIANRVIEQKGDRVYTFTRDRIKWHKEQNHLLITISGSPSELVREMANKYGFDDYKGAVYIVDEEDKYTGDVIPMWDSESKEKAINELVEKYNIDLSKSYAYGDTAGDYTMFKKVENPFCMNPTKELLKKVLEDEELKEKINVIVERKDVTYKLKVDDIQFN
ncbi:HAD-IB family hydrolase [Clostridium thermobutyricum]|uniref:phosphoserine phosphatase n=1 Tax=Clostridium thermobutyricum DSM 4928 TaxID=1121339 RepID=A0A1V4SRS8_9CLOT|nr:HAD-IB family hydrolase [Clostridium thermobutyricum]OPX46562.1 haloacid dehalogenase-like hydrolase [Clostridium thermobutyricum DSM 4928]